MDPFTVKPIRLKTVEIAVLAIAAKVALIFDSFFGQSKASPPREAEPIIPIVNVVTGILSF